MHRKKSPPRKVSPSDNWDSPRIFFLHETPRRKTPFYFKNRNAYHCRSSGKMGSDCRRIYGSVPFQTQPNIMTNASHCHLTGVGRHTTWSHGLGVYAIPIAIRKYFPPRLERPVYMKLVRYELLNTAWLGFVTKIEARPQTNPYGKPSKIIFCILDVSQRQSKSDCLKTIWM